MDETDVEVTMPCGCNRLVSHSMGARYMACIKHGRAYNVVAITTTTTKYAITDIGQVSSEYESETAT